MKVSHRFGQSSEGGLNIRIRDRFRIFLWNLEPFCGGDFEFRSQIHAQDKFELLVLFEIRLLNSGIVYKMKLLFFNRVTKTFSQEAIFEFILNIGGVAATHHLERSMAWAKSWKFG